MPTKKEGFLLRLWKYIFDPAVRIRCPYCLQFSRLRKSDLECKMACKRVLPDLYRAHCDRLPPLFVPVLGWTGCGKSWSLFSMINTLEKMTKVWGDYSYQVAEPGSLKWLRDQVRVMMFGTAKERAERDKATATGVQQAYMFLLNNLPNRWRGRDHTGRTLVLRDFAGEIFSGEGKFENIPPEHLSFIAEADVVVLMFRLTDLTPGADKKFASGNESSAGTTNPDLGTKKTAFRGMDELLDVYITSMVRKLREDKGLDFPAALKKFTQAKRKVIVTLGCADELRNENMLPPHLSKYLSDDPIDKAIRSEGSVKWTDKDLALYLEKLDRSSDAIREYLDHRYPDAQNMIRKAEANNIQLKFCLTSATGPVKLSEGSEARLEPQRILDPLLSALKFGEVPRPVGT